MRASQDKTWAAGRKRPGEAGKGAGAAWEGKGFRRRKRGREGRAETEKQESLHGACVPKATWSSDCPHLHKGLWEPDGRMSWNPKTRGGAGWPEEQEQIRQDADSPEAKHSSPEPPWGQRAYGLVVSLGCPQRLRREPGLPVLQATPSPHPCHHHLIPGGAKGPPSQAMSLWPGAAASAF